MPSTDTEMYMCKIRFFLRLSLSLSLSFFPNVFESF